MVGRRARVCSAPTTRTASTRALRSSLSRTRSHGKGPRAADTQHEFGMIIVLAEPRLQANKYQHGIWNPSSPSTAIASTLPTLRAPFRI